MSPLAADRPASLRDGATVMLVRDGAEGPRPLEVLMLERHPATAFGAVWAFPGGVVEPTDQLAPGAPGAPDDRSASARLGLAAGGGAFWAAALRETLEETGLHLAPEDLHYFAHWITPEGVPRRFDTRFFVAAAPEGEAAHDEREHTALAWVRPAEALAAHAAGRFELIHPTIRTLEALARFATAGELLEAAAAATHVIEVDDGLGRRIHLPGDPGHPGPAPS